MAVVSLHGHRHREPELLPVVLDPLEELPEAILGVGDRELLEDRAIGAGNSYLVGLAPYIHTDTDHGVYHGAPPLGVSSSVSRLLNRATPQRAAPSRWTPLG